MTHRVGHDVSGDAASRVATRVTLKWDEPVTVDLSLSRVQVK